jgi:hypothetical protein
MYGVKQALIGFLSTVIELTLLIVVGVFVTPLPLKIALLLLLFAAMVFALVVLYKKQQRG